MTLQAAACKGMKSQSQQIAILGATGDIGSKGPIFGVISHSYGDATEQKVLSTFN